uniref:Protease n=1 Tax=viral metagenome TaxID=1070528 RepID=A0A6C0BF19_9ZZZZ
MSKRNHSSVYSMLPFTKRVKKESEEEEEEEERFDLAELFSRSRSSHSSCYTMNNHIYFNDDITMESVMVLNRAIRELQNDLIILGIKNDIEPPPIKLHLTTYGGLVYAAFSVIACIKSSKIPVHTIIDGYAASAGTLISVCGARRYIHRHSSMMIHELSAGMWGRMSVMEERMEDLKKMMDKLKEIYTTHTKLTNKKLDKILKKDSDWYADECLANGLVDEIIE